MADLTELKAELNSLADSKRAEASKRYFKTGKGEYGEGDVFLGIGGTIQRKIAKKYWKDFNLKEVQELLNSKMHEYRQVGLLILCEKYRHAKKDLLEKRKIYEFYLNNTKNINNWDLVDISCPHIVGDFLLREGTDILKMLAKSKNIWERRISIISTFAFIKKRNLGESLAIAEMLLNDEHDLIHKAVGWTLREVGKKNMEVLEIFLKPRYKSMPRTALRYAIEKFPEEKRKKYLKGEI